MTAADSRALVASLTVAMLAMGCAPQAIDIGPAGALRVVREHMSSHGLPPDDYDMRVEEEPCEVGGGRCYCVAVWPRVYENPGWMQYWVEPMTGQINQLGIVD